MPPTTSYSLALVLGIIVTPEYIKTIEEISQAHPPMNAAENELSPFFSYNRSIERPMPELVDMKIDKKPTHQGNKDNVPKKVNYINEQIKAAFTSYIKEKITPQKFISDALQMNVQYFSFNENTDTTQTHAATITSYVCKSVSFFSDEYSNQVNVAINTKVKNSILVDRITGTLVVSIGGIYENSQALFPLIIDIDKAVRAWGNCIQKDKINTYDVPTISNTDIHTEKTEENSFKIISGNTYDLSYDSTVNILNATNTQSSQDMESVAASLQETFDIEGWFASGIGGFTVSSSFSDSVKSLLDIQNIQLPYCTLVYNLQGS